MRILLLGDYSSVHLELRNYLKSQGVDIILASDGDGYKNLDRDIDLSISSNFLNKLDNIRFIRRALAYFSLLMDILGLKGLFIYLKMYRTINSMKGFDIIQIINPIPIASFSSISSYLLISKILKNNPQAKLYLLAAGDDYEWATYCLNNKNTTYFKNFSIKNLSSYIYTLKYKYGLFYKQLHKYVISRAHKIVPILDDYYRCYKNNSKCTEIIPIGISTEKIVTSIRKTEYPVNIFHGWQLNKDLRKGNQYLHSAVLNVLEDLGESFIHYSVVQSVPYSEYVTLYNSSDLFLDQVFSFDRGVNGILGMAAAKVVFSGFTNAQLDKEIGVNAQPNVDALAREIKAMILDIQHIDRVKNNALNYVLEHHQIHVVADKYMHIWSS